MKKIFLLVVISVLQLNVYAFQFEEGGIVYTTEGEGKVSVSAKQGGYGEHVAIPAKVKHKDKWYKVTGIGYGAFQNNKKLGKLSIMASLEYIGDYAFSGCTELFDIYLPASVTYIGNSAFRNCTNLAHVNMPGDVKTIPSGAFSGCTSLSTFYIPQTCETIGESAFKNCSSLIAIHIPHKVKEIGSQAFQNCTNLQMVTLPLSLTSLSNHAFANCSKLHTIVVPYYKPVYAPSSVFDGVDMEKCKLNVPKKAVEAHRNAKTWRYFYTIEEMEEEEGQ